MKWKHNKKEDSLKELKDEFHNSQTRIQTCCDCEIFMYVQQTYNYRYEIKVFQGNVCEMHKTDAMNRYVDKIRKQVSE
jgi:hypothetical protein